MQLRASLVLFYYKETDTYHQNITYSSSCQIKKAKKIIFQPILPSFFSMVIGNKHFFILGLTLPVLWLLSPKAQGCEVSWKPSKPCHVGVHWIALAEYYQMSTNMIYAFSHFSAFLHYCILAKLATSSIGNGEMSLRLLRKNDDNLPKQVSRYA